jgi:hypothetical protein
MWLVKITYLQIASIMTKYGGFAETFQVFLQPCSKRKIDESIAMLVTSPYVGMLVASPRSDSLTLTRQHSGYSWHTEEEGLTSLFIAN